MTQERIDTPPPADATTHLEPQPGARRQLIVIYGATLLALLCLSLLVPVLFDLTNRQPSCAQLQAGRAFTVGFVLLLVTAGAFVVQRGRRVLRAGRVPLPDDPVWVRTRVRTGVAVAIEAGACFATGAFLLLVPPLLAVAWWDGWSRLFQGFPGCG